MGFLCIGKKIRGRAIFGKARLSPVNHSLHRGVGVHEVQHYLRMSTREHPKYLIRESLADSLNFLKIEDDYLK